MKTFLPDFGIQMRVYCYCTINATAKLNYTLLSFPVTQNILQFLFLLFLLIFHLLITRCISGFGRTARIFFQKVLSCTTWNACDQDRTQLVGNNKIF